jgi:hypothetical protein
MYDERNKPTSPADILSPLGSRSQKVDPIAQRVGSLQGKVVGLLDNSKQNASVLLDEIGQILVRDHGVARIVRKAKPTAARSAGYFGLIDPIVEECDAVVNAYGDCGSCTSWCVHDSVTLERRGIPCATINTREFVKLGQSEAIALGLPGLPIITVPHPIGDAPATSVREKARAIADEVVRILTDDARAVEADYTNRYIASREALQGKDLACPL